MACTTIYVVMDVSPFVFFLICIDEVVSKAIFIRVWIRRLAGDVSRSLFGAIPFALRVEGTGFVCMNNSLLLRTTLTILRRRWHKKLGFHNKLIWSFVKKISLVLVMAIHGFSSLTEGKADAFLGFMMILVAVLCYTKGWQGMILGLFLYFPTRNIMVLETLIVFQHRTKSYVSFFPF